MLHITWPNRIVIKKIHMSILRAKGLLAGGVVMYGHWFLETISMGVIITIIVQVNIVIEAALRVGGRRWRWGRWIVVLIIPRIHPRVNRLLIISIYRGTLTITLQTLLRAIHFAATERLHRRRGGDGTFVGGQIL